MRERAAASFGKGAEVPDIGKTRRVIGVAGVGAAGEELGAFGVGRRYKLIGAAVGEVVGLGLLADGLVGAAGGKKGEGIVWEVTGFRRRVRFRRKAVVVGDAFGEAFEVGFDGLVRAMAS